MRAPRAGVGGPEVGVVVAAGFDEAEVIAVGHRRRVDLERSDEHAFGRLLVVEREAARRRRRGRGRARRRRRRAARLQEAERAIRSRAAPARRASRAATRTPRRACLRGRARDGGSSSPRRRPRRQRSRRCTRRAASRAGRRARRATAARRASGRRARVGAESKIASGPAIFGATRGDDAALAIGAVRPAQDPELGEPGDVAELPRDRVDAGLRRHAPRVVVAVERARERRRARVAQRLGEGGAGEAARVSGRRRAHSAMPSSIDGFRIAARHDRLAGARRREQRQLAHGGALAALPRAGRAGRGRRDRRRGRRRRPADRAPRAPRRGVGRALARAPAGGADRGRADRHRSLPRPRPRP